MSGVELQKELSLRDRKFPFVFISGESTISQAVEAVTQGAIEFLIKPFTRESLLTAVAKAISIDTERTRASERNFAFKERMSVLSPRERQVFGLLAQGYNNAELVDKLGVALSTVKEYKSELMFKLGLKTLSQLISLSAASVNETSNKK
jgi:FixJ family two-component response regulator